MNLNKLYDLADKEKIDIFNYKLRNSKARIIQFEGTNILMDYSQIDTESEEKCILAEELGHYYHSAYYSLFSDQNFINKQEYKAKRSAINILIPYEVLLRVIRNGITTIYELADYFDVTIEFMQNALNFYNNKLMMTKVS